MNRLFLGFFLVTFAVFSQEKTSLKKALKILESKHKIVFSYNDNQIQKFQNIIFNEKKTLENVLIDLTHQIKLVFENIDENTYVIRSLSQRKKSICGKIFSLKTKKELPFVNISFNDKSLYSNSLGDFEIKDALADGFITLNSLTYKTKTILVADFTKNCKEIYLEEELNQLEEIVITNYLTKGFSKKKDGSIVLNSKELGILPGVIEPDVLQALQLIPGVQSPDETASGIHIRGSTPDQNLVLFDGMKMYNFSHFFGLISAFNPYITNNVKLYKSRTHAKYGNNVGGVLDINIENKIPIKTSMGFGTTLTHADVFIKTPIYKNKIGLVLSARRSITDFINNITYQKFSDVVFQNTRISDIEDAEVRRITEGENTFFYEDYHTKVIAQPNDKNRFSFSYLYNQNNLNFIGTNAPRLTQTIRDDINIQNKSFRFNWKHGRSEKGVHNFSFNKTNFDKNYLGNRTRELRNGNFEDEKFSKSNVIKETSFEYLFEKQTINNNNWQFGYQFSDYNLDYNFFRDTPKQPDIIDDFIGGETYNHAIFGEYQFKNSTKWLINLGVRLQHFNGVNKNFLEPRLDINYKFNKNLRLKASTELKHQSIGQVLDFRNDDLGGLFDRFWTLSDGVNLSVLKSIQTSLGLNYQKNKWTVNAEIYQKNIDGIGLLIDENIKNKKNFSGTNKVIGLDVLLKKEWNNYNTWVSYSLSKSTYQFDELNNGKDFNGSFDVPHNLIWSHNYSYKKIDFSLGWRFRKGIPYTVKTAKKIPDPRRNRSRIRINFENLNTERLPNYQRIDFSTSYKFDINSKKGIKGVFGLTFQNIMNTKNILNRDYEIETKISGVGRNRTEESVLVETDRISLGFVPNAVFRVRF